MPMQSAAAVKLFHISIHIQYKANALNAFVYKANALNDLELQFWLDNKFITVFCQNNANAKTFKNKIFVCKLYSTLTMHCYHCNGIHQ